VETLGADEPTTIRNAMRYRLSTLMILAAVLPPALAMLPSASSVTLGVVIVFVLYVSLSDARPHSRDRDE
jgi:hypothetical protein